MYVHAPIVLLTAALLIAPAHWCGANGGGSMPGSGSIGSSVLVQPSPEELARSAYSLGVHSIKDAKDYEQDAVKADKAEKKTKLLGKEQKAYGRALDQFNRAVRQQPNMYQAWNYIGFANRHLGHYDEALRAYARALELKPDYSDAIEYRGEAYLGLNQPDGAKQAYMSLFGTARPLADQLLAAMQQWLNTRRSDAQGVSGADLDALSQWVEERAQIARQTVSLAIGAAPRAWP